LVVTHFHVVSDQDRSREFYRSVFGANVVLERDPVIMKIANSWLVLNVGGGPTDDNPCTSLPGWRTSAAGHAGSFRHCGRRGGHRSAGWRHSRQP
jgi:catechol 2,3-dioxygenase-like lactoylglutathione lyase family enzyme